MNSYLIIQRLQKFSLKMSTKQNQLYFTYPPDIEKCTRHRLAMRIFKGIDKDQTGAECQCCERRIGVTEEVGQCWYDNIKLAYLGPGIPLLFTFIKNSILLLIVLIVTFTGFALYSNLKGDYCQTSGCSHSMFDNISLINKISDTSYMTIQNYTLLGFVLISIVVFQYIRYNFRRTEDECDDIVTSPSDYALILRRLPEDTQRNDIQQMIQDRRKFLTPEERNQTQNLKIVNIVMSFSMTEYNRIKQENKQQFLKLLQDEKHAQFKPKPLPQLQKTASFAIVIFSKQQSKEFFKYKPNICQKLLQCLWTPCIPRSDFQVKGQKIAVERAPQPDDIVWENSKISMQGAICRKTIYSLISIILLLLGGAAQYGLAIAKTKASQDSTTQLLLSTASSVTVSILNAIIQIFLVFTSLKQRNQTITQYNTVLMVKISFFQFLNTGIFIVLANFLADPDNFSLTKGLVFQITQVMILNAVIPNITLFILTYFEIVQKIKRCLIEKKKLKSTQIEANLIYQGPSAQIPYKYSYVFKTIWLTAFYAPLVPIVVPISLIGLMLNYLLEKCLFGRAYSCPNRLSSMVNESAVELMQYFLLIISLGEYIVYLYFVSFKPELVPLYWGIPIYISIAISVIHLLLPMDTLNNKLFKMPKDDFVYPNYEKVDQNFQVTYEMTNPGYQCNRKRKRDAFIINKLFGPGGIQMTGMGLFGGMGSSKPAEGVVPNTSPSPQKGLGMLIPGLAIPQGGIDDSDNKNGLLAQQNNNIYSNTNYSPAALQLNNNNPNQNNPFAAIFNNPITSPNNINVFPNPNQNPNQPINQNQVNPSFNNGNSFPIPNQNNNGLNLMGVPPNFRAAPNNNMQVIQNVLKQQDLNNSVIFQNNDNQQKSKLLSNPNQINQSDAKDVPNTKNNILSNQVGRKISIQNNLNPSQQLGGFNKNPNEPKPVNFFKNVPPGFNVSMGPSYYNTFNRPTFGSSTINLNGMNLGAPIPIGSESQSSYSSTKQIKKAFKIQGNQLHPFTQGRFL